MKDNGLISAFNVSENGEAHEVSWSELKLPAPDAHWQWLHLDRLGKSSRTWLKDHSGLCANLVEAMLSPESRPRFTCNEQGALLILRDVKHDAVEQSDDLVPVCIWVDVHRVITVVRQPSDTLQEMQSRFSRGKGAPSPLDLVMEIASGATQRQDELVRDIGLEVDLLEDEQDTSEIRSLRERLISVRHKTIPMQRYLKAQRDAIAAFLAADLVHAGSIGPHRSRLSELTDRATRFIEDAQAARERLIIIHDSVTSRNAERMNQTMLVMTIAAAVFLPLGFVTGLLGINVGGIPGANTHDAFWLVALGLLVLGVGEFTLMRWLRWI